jgi:hypothetical protein
MAETVSAPAAGVGKAINEALGVVESYAQPVAGTAVDPVSGITVPIYTDKEGLHAVSADVFDDYLTAPRFRLGTAELTDLNSFIDHANRFKGPSSAIFASDDRSRPGLTSVIDYNPAGFDSPPAFGRHRGHFAFPLSDEWKAWQAKNGMQRAMTMREFAEFLEDRIIDVEHPDDNPINDERTKQAIALLGGIGAMATPTRLLELSQSLAVYENATIKEATRLASGEGHLEFITEHVDASGGAVDIPSLFVIAIPVFRKGEFYRIVARLRYRARPQVVFWVRALAR